MVEQTETVITNQPYENFTTIQFKIDTQKIQKDLWKFLKGIVSTTEFAPDGTPQEVLLLEGTPQANELGIQSIMSYYLMVVNPHTIQGNLDKEQYKRILYDMQLHLGRQFMTKSLYWGISQEQRKHILYAIMHDSEIILSRPIEDGERKSMAGAMRTERHLVQNEETKKRFGFV
jgi:hypothetical protein